jgi:oxygen-independent coproporphyrinogen-3 oxidase
MLSESMRKRAETLLAEDKLHQEGSRYFNKNYFLSDELALYILG